MTGNILSAALAGYRGSLFASIRLISPLTGQSFQTRWEIYFEYHILEVGSADPKAIILYFSTQSAFFLDFAMLLFLPGYTSVPSFLVLKNISMLLARLPLRFTAANHPQAEMSASIGFTPSLLRPLSPRNCLKRLIVTVLHPV